MTLPPPQPFDPKDALTWITGLADEEIGVVVAISIRALSERLGVSELDLAQGLAVTLAVEDAGPPRRLPARATGGLLAVLQPDGSTNLYRLRPEELAQLSESDDLDASTDLLARRQPDHVIPPEETP